MLVSRRVSMLWNQPEGLAFLLPGWSVDRILSPLDSDSEVRHMRSMKATGPGLQSLWSSKTYPTNAKSLSEYPTNTTKIGWICTVDGWNPANQLRLVLYPIIYKVLAPSQVVFSPDFWTIKPYHRLFPNSGTPPSPGSSSVRSTGSCVPRSAFPTGSNAGIFAMVKWVVAIDVTKDLPCLMDSRQPVFAGESCRTSILGKLARRRGMV